MKSINLTSTAWGMAIILAVSLCSCGKENRIEKADFEGDWYGQTEMIENGDIANPNVFASYSFISDGSCIQRNVRYNGDEMQVSYEMGSWSNDSQSLKVSFASKTDTYTIAGSDEKSIFCNKNDRTQFVFHRFELAYEDIMGRWEGSAEFLDDDASFRKFQCELSFNENHRCTVVTSIDGEISDRHSYFCHLAGIFYLLDENMNEVYSGKLEYGKITFSNKTSYVRLEKVN